MKNKITFTSHSRFSLLVAVVVPSFERFVVLSVSAAYAWGALKLLGADFRLTSFAEYAGYVMVYLASVGLTSAVLFIWKRQFSGGSRENALLAQEFGTGKVDGSASAASSQVV